MIALLLLAVGLLCCGQPNRTSRATPSGRRNMHYCVVDPESDAADHRVCFYNAYEARTYARKKGLAPPLPRYIEP